MVRASSGGEPSDVAALPGRLDRPGVVVLSDGVDRLTGGYAIQHGETSQGRTTPAAASDFHSFILGSAPRLAQRVSRVVLVGG